MWGLTPALPERQIVKLKTSIDLIARLRVVSERDAGAVWADAEISVPLTSNGVLALYSKLLDMVIGEEG